MDPNVSVSVAWTVEGKETDVLVVAKGFVHVNEDDSYTFGYETPRPTIAEMAAHYLDELRQVQPVGPYFLGGRSLGGIIAYEMACQLRAQGDAVALLAVLDSYPVGHDRASVAGTTLGSVLSPTLQKLGPFAKALGPALRATRPLVRDTTPVLRDQLRPFARDVRPIVDELQPAAHAVAGADPEIVKVLSYLNTFFNAVAYNPPGSEEGFLFWGAWLSHIGPSVLTAQDAFGRGQLPGGDPGQPAAQRDGRHLDPETGRLDHTYGGLADRGMEVVGEGVGPQDDRRAVDRRKPGAADQCAGGAVGRQRRCRIEVQRSHYSIAHAGEAFGEEHLGPRCGAAAKGQTV